MKKILNARFMMITSMSIFGTIGPFVRNIHLPSGEIALYRAILATLFIGALFLVKRQKIDFVKIKKELPLLLISGIAMGINWILLFQAYNYTTVTLATLSYYFAPVIITVLCPLLFKEKMTYRQLICFVMSTIGIVLITGIGAINSTSKNFIGILLGLGAAFLYASVILINKFIKKTEGLDRTFLQFISAIIVLLPYVLFTDGVNVIDATYSELVCLLVVGLIHSGVAYCLYFSAVKQLPGQKTAILSYIDPLVAVLSSVIILKEEISLTQILGGVLILGFTLWNELSSEKNKLS